MPCIPVFAVIDRGIDLDIQSTKDAIKFYEAKVEELSANLKDLEAIVGGKSKNLSLIEDGML